MTDIFVQKAPTGTGYALLPCHQSDLDAIKKLPLTPLRVKVTRPRNVQFLRKYFALLNVLFDLWEPDEKSQIGEKNFRRFRSDMTILAGFYETYIRVDGSTRIDPQSISFANMDEETFSDLYNKTIDAGVKYVARNYTGDDLNMVVNQVLEFG